MGERKPSARKRARKAQTNAPGKLVRTSVILLPRVNARAYLVENPVTGEVLVQHGAWGRVPIASLTKLMTVLVTLDHAKWNDIVRVRSDAASAA